MKIINKENFPFFTFLVIAGLSAAGVGSYILYLLIKVLEKFAG